MRDSILLVVMALFAGAAGSALMSGAIQGYMKEMQPSYVTEVREVTVQENAATKTLIERVARVPLRVRTQTSRGVLEGMVVPLTADGLVVTLASLIPAGSSPHFEVEGKTTSFQVLKRDTRSNLALVKLEDVNLPVTGFFKTEEILPGEHLILTGLVYDEEESVVANTGIVRGVGGEMISTTLREEQRLSGAPVFDLKGDLVGVASISAAGSVSVIPSHLIRAFSGL